MKVGLLKAKKVLVESQQGTPVSVLLPDEPTTDLEVEPEPVGPQAEPKESRSYSGEECKVLVARDGSTIIPVWRSKTVASKKAVDNTDA